MTPCTHSPNGCNYPESDCSGACMKQRFYPKPIPMPIEYAEPEPDAFYLFDPWPLGVRLCLIAFLVIVASVVIAVFSFV